MLGVKFSKNSLSGLLFVNDFVGLAMTRSALQILFGIVLIIVNIGGLKPMLKCAVVILLK